jgi:hypothetical protein
MFDWLKRQLGASPQTAMANGSLDPLVARSEQLYDRMSSAGEVELSDAEIAG